MPWAVWAIPAAVGALGLYQSNQQANAARHAANTALKPQLDAETAIYGLGKAYDPATEDRKAIAGANQNATATLESALRDLNGSFAAAGGDPTGDTAFNVSAANTANRVIDPMRSFVAELLSTQTQRKADMLARTFGAPAGQLAGSYFAQAGQAQMNANSSLGMFLDALKNMPWHTAVPSAGNITNPQPVEGGGGTPAWDNQGAGWA